MRDRDGYGDGDEPRVYDTSRGDTAHDWIPGALDTDDDVSRYREICTSQIAIVDVRSGKVSRIGTPGVFGLIDPSPDGAHLLVERFNTTGRRGTWLSALEKGYEVWDLPSGHCIPVGTSRMPSQGSHVHCGRWQWEPRSGATLISRQNDVHAQRLVKLRAPFQHAAHAARVDYGSQTEVWCEAPIQSRLVIPTSGLNLALQSYVDDYRRKERSKTFLEARDIVITYRDTDGALLEAVVHVPEKWSGKKPLPCLVWMYPDIFESKSKSRKSRARAVETNRYLRPIRFSPLVMLSRGFAVMVHPPMPVKYCRSAKQMVDDMVALIRALFRALVSKGVADRKKLVIGGHCRGAFAAALTLSRTRGLVRAGALCAGLYNQLLLPLGGIDPRPTWRAPDAHMALSPILQVHRIKAPVLIMHGAEDDLFSGFHAVNFATQSKQFYAAIAASGGAARYVEFPGEGHVLMGQPAIVRASEELVRFCERHTS